MTADRIDAITALLIEAEGAHAVFEATELGGVYDQAWPAWYAMYVVEHGIGAMLERAVTTEELASSLTACNAAYERLEPTTREPWPTYTARQLAGDR
jgi:hypothetical protein